MPDLKISQLPVATTPLAGTELVPLVQGGVTVQSTVNNVLTGTVPSGTANGVLYLNGSKVVTSGSGLTFDGTNLGIVGTGTRGLSITTNTSGNPIISFTAAGANAGFVQYSRANQAIELSSDGVTPFYSVDYTGIHKWFGPSSSEQMRLTSTGLGIGTSSPQKKLHLYDGIATVGAYQQIIESYIGGYGAGISFQSILGGSSTLAEMARITADGESAWQASAATTQDAGLRFYTALNGTVSENMRLDASGNLGLGVTPSAWSGVVAMQLPTGAAITGFSDTTNLVQNAYFNGSWRYISTAAAALAQVTQGAHQWFTAPSGTAGNAISFSQVMTLDASGNLGIGVTNPTAKLHLYEPTAASTLIRVLANGGQQAVLQLAGNGGTFGATSFDVFQDGGSDAYVANRSNASLRFWTNNLERARIPAAGGMVVGTAALATNATDGFLYVPTCAGTPTGTPTTQTGTAPIVVDTTNNKLYFYSGGAWRDAGP